MAAALLALCSISSTASIPHKRAAASDTSLYAYGSIANGIGTNGGAIIYADGKIPKLSSIHFASDI
jgi:hypothetical protein